MSEHRTLIFKSLKKTLIDHAGSDVLDRASTVLEFGSGRNGWIEAYKLPHQRAYALDLYDYKDIWKKRGIEYIKSDGRTIALATGTIDLVTCHSVLEHVGDVFCSLSEINRVLKVGGILYATVSPLYYSPAGSHMKSLPDWEHLRPSSPYFMISEAIQGNAGSHLNKLTISELMRHVGQLPWDIALERRMTDRQDLPSFLHDSHIPHLDLLTREFRMVAWKTVDVGST